MGPKMAKPVASITGVLMDGKYSIELWKPDNSAVEAELHRDNQFDVASTLYLIACTQYPGRLVLLRNPARTLARSDRPDTMPEAAWPAFRGFFENW